MSYLNEAEIQLGKENYEVGNYWQPTCFEYRAKPAPVRPEDSDTAQPTEAQGGARKGAKASTGAGKGTSQHKARKAKV